MVSLGEEIKNMALELNNAMTAKNLSEIPVEGVERFANLMVAHRSSNVLIIGAGRSQLVGRALALRLQDMGYSVNVLGETEVPPITKKDLALVVPGSGHTTEVVAAAETAKNTGATVIAITSFPKSPLGKLADCVVTVKGRVNEREEGMGDYYFTRQIPGPMNP